MAQEQESIYAGSGRIITGFKRGVSICLDDIQDHAVKSERNGKFYVSLNIVDRKEPNQWGKDVDVFVDTWKPGTQKPSYQPRTEQPRPRQSTQAPQRQNYAPRQSAPAGPEMFDSDQIPF